MGTINITNARKNLYTIIEEVQENHEPLVITGKKGSAVLVSESDWKAIQETLYLLSIPGMRDSLLEGQKEKIEDCVETLDW